MALRKLERSPIYTTVPHISTGLASLDQALGIGGIPRGRITELLGTPTSGKTTLANIIVAHAQQTGSVGAYVDLSQTFDPHYAAKCGIDLHDLLIVQPYSGEEALEMTISLIANGSVSVLVFDSVSDLLAGSISTQFLSSALSHLAGCTAKSHCALIFLTTLIFGGHSSEANYPRGFGLPYYATARLLIERQRWLRRRGDVWGYSARMTVLKNKLAPPGKLALVRFIFNGQVRATSEDDH
jgi:recombination protein RecA